MHGHDIIVIGASMGGFETLRTLMQDLAADLPAAIFVVLHISPRSPGTLGEILDRSGALPARLAEDGEPIRRGRVYVAPPDHHLLVKQDIVRLKQGPRENRSRPAIDPLFRSAAVAYRSRVVGVVLSGNLDDPADAAYPEMPTHDLEATAADHIVPLAEIGALLDRLAEEPAVDSLPVPRDLILEAQLTERTMDDIDKMDEIGGRTSLACPACGGVLWMMPDQPVRRYRCHLGHAYTEFSLLDEQTEATDHALLVALRTMEDRIKVLERLARDDRTLSRRETGNDYAERAAELRRHTQQIRKLILGIESEGAPVLTP